MITHYPCTRTHQWLMIGGMATSTFEVSGTQFERGVFDIYLEKPSPKPLKLIFRIGPLTGRLIGIALLSFSFLFSTSRAPTRFLLENNYAPSIDAALQIQRSIGYSFFFLAVFFYMIVFFFRRERMQISFNKTASILSVEREPGFRFSLTKRGHVPFQDIQKIEKLPADTDAPHGKVVIYSKKMPKEFQAIEFRVLSDEQFEYFPLNIERILNR